MCENVEKCGKMWKNAENVEKCVKMRKNVEKCVKMCEKCGKMCENVEKCVKMCWRPVFYILLIYVYTLILEYLNFLIHLN